MKKVLVMMLSLAVMLGTAACGAKEDGNITIIGGADGPTSIFVASKIGDDDAAGDASVADDVNGAADAAGDDQAAGDNQAVGEDATLMIPGTWQTASIGYMDGDDMQPDYYVQFTETEVNYGHMKDGEFVLDHSDEISLIEIDESGSYEAQAGSARYKVQAESASGVQYTYQSAEGDADILEYYETWNEEDFPEAYRGGASLSR